MDYSHSRPGFALYILVCTLSFVLSAHAQTTPAESTVQENWDDNVIVNPIIYEPPVQKVKSYGNGTCVPYARERSGIQIYGSANTFLDQALLSGYNITDKPEVGAIVVLAESPMGHVAVIEELTDSGFIVSEQNFKGLYIVSRREVLSGYKGIVGFIVK